MLANAAQTFTVILLVAAAAGYLLVLARRTWKGGGGSLCAGCGADTLPPSVEERGDRTGEQTTPRRFIPSENLADLARRHKNSRSSADASSRPPETRRTEP
jgi:hypothetical protein